MSTDSLHEVVWVTGPDAGECRPLAAGRSLVGRAPSAAVRCADPVMQPFHAAIDQHPDGTVWCTPLSSRPPVRLGGVPVSGTVRWPAGECLEIGNSRLGLFARASDEPGEGVDPLGVLDDAVVRRPRAVPSWHPAEIVPPPATVFHDDAPGGLVPALIGVGASALMALLLHQMMFVVFGALGACVALGSWLAQRTATVRRRRARRVEAAEATAEFERLLEADRQAFVAAHLAATPTATVARRVAADPDGRLWSRRPAHADAMRVSLGLGAVAWRTCPSPTGHVSSADASEPMTIDDLPVPVDLGAGARVALVGPGAHPVARSVLLQLVTSCGPADLRVIVVSAEPTAPHPGAWNWLTGLPHATLPDGRSTVIEAPELGEVLAELEVESHSAPHVVLVVDDVASLSTLTSAVRRLLHGRPATALLAVLPGEQSAPQLCSSVLGTSSTPVGRWVVDTSSSLLPVPVRWCGVGLRAAAAAVASLGRFRDPEDALASAARLPVGLALADLIVSDGGAGSDASELVDAVLRRWEHHGTGRPSTPLGRAADGVVDVDLVRDGPHALIAGTTGSGKSELLRTLVVGLSAALPPTLLQFVLVDYKGGAAFDACVRLPHVGAVVTDLDQHLADRVVRSLHAELKRREAVLRRHGAADLGELRVRQPDEVLPRLVVIVDEFATLVVEQPDFLRSLVAVAQRGRSLGVHLVLATQRPAGSVTDDIRANTGLRIALRLPDEADSVDVVGDASAAHLPRRSPGRAVMRLGVDERVVFQAAQVGDAVIDAVCAAARVRALPAATPPWQPPLPEVMTALAVEPGAIGLLDDPDGQRRLALRWSPSDGSVVVVGAAGSGVSSTLATLASAAVSRAHAADVFVLARRSDPAAGPFAALVGHSRCAFVDVADRPRVHRLLHHVVANPGPGQSVLVVDDLQTVRRELDGPAGAADLDRLDAVLGGHAVPELVVVAGSHHAASVPAALTARCAHRIVLQLHDPHDAMALGVPARCVPTVGPGRAHVLPHALEAQLVLPPGRVMDAASDGRRATVDVVPPVVDPTWLPPGRHDDGSTWLTIGADVVSTGTAWFELPDDEHALVIGPSRSGRSTALTRLVSSWRTAHPTGRVVAVLPRRSSFDLTLADDVLDGRGSGDAMRTLLADPRERRTLVVVDDAELVDDEGDVLRDVTARPSGIEVVAAARPDALRQRYGHWTATLRRSRRGLLAASCGELDGDLFGVSVPRRLPVDPRPGLMWVVDDAVLRVAQVAFRAPELPEPSGQRDATAAAQCSSAATTSSTISRSVRP